MKKFFTILLGLFLLVSQGNTQVLFSNDFEDGTLGELTAVDADGLTAHSSISTNIGTSFTVLQLNDGNYIAIANSYFATPAQASNWLILPKVSIVDDNTVIKWTGRSFDKNFKDGYKVMLSTTGVEIADFTVELFSTSGENEIPTDRSISLDDYKGQDVYLAFYHDATDKYLLGLDNLTVKVRDQKDVAVKSMTYSESEICTAKDITTNMVFVNEGLETVTSVEVEWSLNDEKGTETFDGLSIAPGASKSLDIQHVFALSTGTKQSIGLSISKVNGDVDAATSDNNLSETFTIADDLFDFGGTTSHDEEVSILEEIGKGKVVLLDFFASWCGPCETSTPKLNKVYVDNIDLVTVIGVTIEENDDKNKVNNLGWGGTYPKFAYAPANSEMWTKYNSCLNFTDTEGNEIGGGAIPTFIMLCPKEGGGVEISLGKTGIGSFDATILAFSTRIQECNRVMVDVQEEGIAINDITLTPNPVQDRMSLEFFVDVQMENLSATIVNGVGQTVMTLDVTNRVGLHTTDIDVSNLESGMYFVKFSQGNRVSTQKFIKL